jgi:tricorn protease-like protein
MLPLPKNPNTSSAVTYTVSNGVDPRLVRYRRLSSTARSAVQGTKGLTTVPHIASHIVEVSSKHQNIITIFKMKLSEQR